MRLILRSFSMHCMLFLNVPFCMHTFCQKFMSGLSRNFEAHIPQLLEVEYVVAPLAYLYHSVNIKSLLGMLFPRNFPYFSLELP